MVEVFVGIGSNVDPERNIRAGLNALQRHFGTVLASPVYRNAPVGFSGDDFLNLVATFECDAEPHELAQVLRSIEVACGRSGDDPRFGPRTLDLDLLLFGDAVIELGGTRVPRPEILEYAFVLRPLADIAGDRMHPQHRRTFAELWSESGLAAHALTPVDLPVLDDDSGRPAPRCEGS